MAVRPVSRGPIPGLLWVRRAPKDRMGSKITAVLPAPSAVAAEHFSRRLAVETDCADVADAMRNGTQDFVLLHVVGSGEDYRRRHVPGAIHLPHREITAERMAKWPPGTVFVPYC